MRYLTRLSILSLSLCSPPLLAQDTSKTHWHEPKFIEQSFIDITFGREYSRKATRLNKWNGTINVEIIDSTADTTLHTQLIHHHLRHLSQVTGQRFTYKQNMQSDMRFYVLSEKAYQNKLVQDGNADLLKTSVCLAQLSTDTSGQITHAAIWLPVERARAHGKLLSCIVEETTQALGLINDSVKVYPSIFNDHSHNDFLTGLDLVLLKLLYLDSLTPGLPEDKTRLVIREALSTDAFQMLIQQAEQRVRIGSLEELINQ